MAGVAVLVYDGDCGFCTTSAHRLVRWSGGSLDVIPWQMADLEALGLTPGECSSAVQLVSPTTRASGGTAVAAALLACRQPYRAAGALLGWQPLHPLVQRAYALVAANRHRLPGSTCAVSDGDEGALDGVARQGAGQPVPPAHG